MALSSFDVRHRVVFNTDCFSVPNAGLSPLMLNDPSLRRKLGNASRTDPTCVRTASTTGTWRSRR